MVSSPSLRELAREGVVVPLARLDRQLGEVRVEEDSWDGAELVAQLQHTLPIGQVALWSKSVGNRAVGANRRLGLLAWEGLAGGRRGGGRRRLCGGRRGIRLRSLTPCGGGGAGGCGRRCVRRSPRGRGVERG